jgi:hypothetical protein
MNETSALLLLIVKLLIHRHESTMGVLYHAGGPLPAKKVLVQHHWQESTCKIGSFAGGRDNVLRLLGMR